MKTKVIAIFTKEGDINRITEKLKDISFESIPKHNHFEFSLIEKLTDIDKLKETFPKFNLVKSIELRENEKGQKYYSLNYELEDKTFIVLVLIIEPILLINGFHADKNYKKFEQSLRKNYATKFV